MNLRQSPVPPGADPAARPEQDSSWRRVFHRVAEEFAHGALFAIAVWLISLPIIKLVNLIVGMISRLAK